MNSNAKSKARVEIAKYSARPAVLAALLAVGGLASGTAVPAFAQDVPPPPAQGDSQRTDGQIEMDVVHALDALQQLKQDWITAATVQGEVTLSGTVASDTNRKLAEATAHQVNGVTKVVNNLKVGDPTQAQSGQDPNQDANQDPAQDPNGGQYPVDNSANNQAPPPPPPPGQPGQPGQAGPRPQYRQAPQPAPPEMPHEPVTLAQGTLLRVRTQEPLNNKMGKEGTPVEFMVARDVITNGVLAIPRGAVVHGRVIKSVNSGALGGRPELALKLETLELEGVSYPLDSDPFDVKGPNKAGRTAGSAFGGALFGALIGGAVGGGGGAAIGAVAGGAGGTAASAASRSPEVWIPSEALIMFHLNTPLTVKPVSRAEALRLAQNAGPNPAQRPTLYRRGPYPYGYPPPPPPGYYYRGYPY